MSNSSLITTESYVQLLTADTGALGWDFAGFHSASSAVVVKGQDPVADHLYVGDVYGVIHKLSLSGGAEQAQLPNAGGIVWGLAYADEVVYANAGNSLTAYKVNPPSLLWKQAMDDYSWGSPFVSDKVVYSGSWDGKLYAIRADGTPEWISTGLNFFAAQPIVANGVVYAAVYAASGGKLVALDAKTGDVIWQSSPPNGETVISPVSIGDGRIYVGTGWGGLLCAFDAATGNELWSSSFGGHPTPPTYWGNRVFAATEHGAGNGYLKALDAADGHLLWTSQVPVCKSGEAVSRAVFDEGLSTNHVFVTSQNGNAYAFQRSNGSLAWQVGIGNSLPHDPVWTEPMESPQWKLGQKLGEYRSIDPLALVLRGDIYVKIHLPYPLPLERIAVRVRQAAEGMNANEKRRALKQLSNLDSVTRILRQAITTPMKKRLKFGQKELS